MVQFVNIREFKTKTEAVMKRLERSDVVLTVRGKPKAVLSKVSEADLSLRKDFTRTDAEVRRVIAGRK
jgi:prevent-host-death family protein